MHRYVLVFRAAVFEMSQQTIGQGYNCGEISENPKPCTDRRGRRGSGSQYPSEPYALFHAPVAELGELN